MITLVQSPVPSPQCPVPTCSRKRTPVQRGSYRKVLACRTAWRQIAGSVSWQDCRQTRAVALRVLGSETLVQHAQLSHWPPITPNTQLPGSHFIINPTETTVLLQMWLQLSRAVLISYHPRWFSYHNKQSRTIFRYTDIRIFLSNRLDSHSSCCCTTSWRST